MLDRSKRYHAVVATETSNPGIVDDIFGFRRTLFVDVLGWDLPGVRHGRERDQFDTDDAVHAALFCDGVLVGGFRAMPTDGPYLSKTLFPELATREPYPETQDIWEISRFGVLPTAGRFAAKFNYALMFWLARARGFRALVALADLTYERFLLGMGVRTRRYGEPQTIGLDSSVRPLVAVAGEIPLSIQSGARFEALTGLAHEMEIIDETLVLGRRRVPA